MRTLWVASDSRARPAHPPAVHACHVCVGRVGSTHRSSWPRTTPPGSEPSRTSSCRAASSARRLHRDHHRTTAPQRTAHSTTAPQHRHRPLNACTQQALAAGASPRFAAARGHPLAPGWEGWSRPGEDGVGGGGSTARHRTTVTERGDHSRGAGIGEGVIMAIARESDRDSTATLRAMPAAGSMVALATARCGVGRDLL